MKDLDKLLKKLIRTGTGRKRFMAAMIGLSVAMLLILAAVQIQANYTSLLKGKSNQDSVANFLVVNKLLTDANLGASYLTDTDIQQLKKQPFVSSLGLLTPSRFKASIQSSSDRFPFYTDIAFESVPNDFIDVNTEHWHWSETDPYIPIIAPNMFLDFYNFQFSFSQNLPQLTQQVVKMLVFNVNIYGPNGQLTLKGRVVGFSDRISSLLVPESFMQWGNDHFGKQPNAQPSRVVIRTNDPGNPALVQYLKDNHLVTDADKTRFSRYRQIVNLVVNISWLTGAVLFLFALLIFTLFIQLTIASCKEEIGLLVTLGASPGQLRKFLIRQFFPPAIWMLGISLLFITILQYAAYKWLNSQHISIDSNPSIYTFCTALAVVLVIYFVNHSTIKSYVRKTRF